MYLKKDTREHWTNQVWHKAEELTTEGEPTTIGELAHETGLSEDTVDNAVFSLSQRGLLEVDDSFILKACYKNK